MSKDSQQIGVGVGAVILDAAGRMLLMQRGPAARNDRGLWSIPTGSLEYGELRSAAIVREVAEELAVEVEALEELGTSDYILKAEGQHWVTTAYLCRIMAGEPTICEPDKCTAVGWYSLSEAEALPLAGHMQQLFDLLRQRQDFQSHT
jgi:ADP-ribose pyrophosphatase YjhB (NUDIX family)